MSKMPVLASVWPPMVIEMLNDSRAYTLPEPSTAIPSGMSLPALPMVRTHWTEPAGSSLATKMSHRPIWVMVWPSHVVVFCTVPIT